MSELFEGGAKKELREQLAHLSDPVRLVHFTQKHACGACRDQRRLLEVLVGLSDKLELEVHELVDDALEAQRYGIDKVPATAVLGKKDHGIRFYGLTGGYELPSLVEAILMVSKGESELDPHVEALAKQISTPLHLEIMVTLTCPYCPQMVRLAHQLAFANDSIRADMVEASEFPELTQRYQVRGVPRTVINESPAFEGALPPQAAILEIIKASDPDLFARIATDSQTQPAERKAVKAAAGEEFDIVVVGAGPAAMSAALYAVRKNRRVAMIGRKVGGQINDTASIENWLGIKHVGGRELAEMFRRHLEAYPVAECLDVQVRGIRRRNHGFEIVTEDGRTCRGRAIVYAAGKRYRRLGVPGEDRFLGRGIAFCATCDAPLYRDKRVAVIGGGNSAMTAVRDLRSYASEIHVVNELPDWQADPILFEEATSSELVVLHPSMRVREFLGDQELEGARLESIDGKQHLDILVDGVFLEIGLEPNSMPVRELVQLNQDNEVPIRRDQSTSIPGFFAAGDVTDEREKQIVIAAGDGARAALSAHRYLSRLELKEHERHKK